MDMAAVIDECDPGSLVEAGRRRDTTTERVAPRCMWLCTAKKHLEVSRVLTGAETVGVQESSGDLGLRLLSR